MVLLGTRPEAIKLAPLIHALRAREDAVRCTVCVTGQHREMLAQVLQLFGITPDLDLRLMEPGQSPARFSGRLLTELDAHLARAAPDWLVVQGDTSTALAGAMAGFLTGCRVAHVEAGLRTGNLMEPFPEEFNRRVVSIAAQLHFAPTNRSRDALIREGVPPAQVHVTGNTVIDALFWMRARLRQLGPEGAPAIARRLAGRRLVLVTGHRRESFGADFEGLCLGLRDLAMRRPDVVIVYPVHLNPQVQEPVHRLLTDVENVLLIGPVAYDEFVWLLDASELVLTDSGGVQEEAPSLGKPVLVLRRTTERPEGVDAGNALLVGPSREAILRESLRLLDDPIAYASMARVANPYGDGRATERIMPLLLA